MEIPNESFQEIIEGKTKILVPKKSITEKVPPKKPVFFNPKAKLNRDFSVIDFLDTNSFVLPSIISWKDLSGISN